jgi:hypothetical protein
MTEGLITRSINVAGDQSTRRNRGKNCTFVHFSKLNHILPIFLRTHPKLTAVKQHRLQSCQDSRPDLSEAMSVFLLIFFQFASLFTGDFRDLKVQHQLPIVRENWL